MFVKGLFLQDRKWKILFVLACVLMFTQSFLPGIGSSLLLGAAESQDHTLLQKDIIVGVFLMILPNIMVYVASKIDIPFQKHMMVNLKDRVMQRLLALHYGAYGRHSRDVYLSFFTNDLDRFEGAYFEALKVIVTNVGVTVLCFITLACLDLPLCVMVSFSVVAILLLSRKLKDRMIRLNIEISDLNAQYSTKIANVFSGLDLIQMNQAQEAFYHRIESITDQLQKKTYAYDYLEKLQGIISGHLATLSRVLILLYISYSISRGAMSFTLAVLLMNMVTMIAANVGSFFPSYATYESTLAMLDSKLESLFDAYEPRVIASKPYGYTESIRFENVALRYGEKVVLKPFDLQIIKGHKYLIKGPSGSGKSTLLKLLSKTIETYTGSINLDHMALSEILYEDFSDHVSVISQDTFLFSDTILNNICLYKPYPQAAIEEALSLSGLKPLIEDLPQGLQTVLSENGQELSGGQCQRIAIARAIISQSEVYLCDEVTAGLPEADAKAIEAVLLSLDATLLNISHKVSDQEGLGYDHVITVDKGYVSHKTLKRLGGSDDQSHFAVSC